MLKGVPRLDPLNKMHLFNAKSEISHLLKATVDVENTCSILLENNNLKNIIEQIVVFYHLLRTKF